jgi:hypothetical protein
VVFIFYRRPKHSLEIVGTQTGEDNIAMLSSFFVIIAATQLLLLWEMKLVLVLELAFEEPVVLRTRHLTLRRLLR